MTVFAQFSGKTYRVLRSSDVPPGIRDKEVNCSQEVKHVGLSGAEDNGILEMLNRGDAAGLRMAGSELTNGKSQVMNKLSNNLPYSVYSNSLPFLVLSIAFSHRVSGLANVVSKIHPNDARFRVVIEMYSKPRVYYTVPCPVSVKNIGNI